MLAAIPLILLVSCSPELPETRTSEAGLIEVHRPEVGWVPCDSPQGARTLVRDTEGKLYYAGQAIMNTSCASGSCHDSTAEAAQRSGAPAGLDFEMGLLPFEAFATSADPATGALAVQVAPGHQEAATELEVQRRRVYDWRSQIWEQVDEGRMPPGGEGQAYRQPRGLTRVALDASGGCTDGAALGGITESEVQAELAVWLACGAPIVESSDEAWAQVPGFEPLQTTGAQLGDIAPACEMQAPGPDVTFEQVFNEVLQHRCASCHAPDLVAGPYSHYDTPEKAYAALVDAPVQFLDMYGAACDPTTVPATYVVPNQPDSSYLLHKMGDPQLASPMYCGLLMPLNMEPLESATSLVRAWIEAGAPGPGQAGGAGGGSGGDGGLTGASTAP